MAKEYKFLKEKYDLEGVCDAANAVIAKCIALSQDNLDIVKSYMEAFGYQEGEDVIAKIRANQDENPANGIIAKIYQSMTNHANKKIEKEIKFQQGLIKKENFKGMLKDIEESNRLTPRAAKRIQQAILNTIGSELEPEVKNANLNLLRIELEMSIQIFNDEKKFICDYLDKYATDGIEL